MNSRPDAQLAAQTPRIAVEANRSPKFDDGSDAVFLASQYGLTADPWQVLVLDAWLGRRADGTLAAKRAGLSVPRQNGKNALLEMVELFKLIVEGRRIMHTAHEIKTAKEAFVRIKSFFTAPETYPELAEQVASIRDTNGQEAIHLTNGGAIKFIARSRGSGRGFTADDLILDEAQELQDAHLAAQMPAISAAPSKDPQIIYTGTPIPPDADGAPFRRLRADALAGKARTIAWHEWSPDALPDPTDKQACLTAAAATNPAAGGRITWEFIAEEYDALDGASFARERLGHPRPVSLPPQTAMLKKRRLPRSAPGLLQIP